MANKVFLNTKGIVEVIVEGDQTIESVKQMGEDAIQRCKDLKADGKPAYILDNILEIGSVPAEARSQVVEIIKSNDYDQLAMVGRGAVLRLGANLMLQATGKGARVKYFDDYDSAVKWLLAV